MLGVTHEDLTSNKLTKQKLKTLATSVAFSFLINKQETHKKIKHIHYETLAIQNYLTNNLLNNNEANMLTAMRSHCVRGIKHNFPKMFKTNLNCPLNCVKETPYADTQEHVLNCSSLRQTWDKTTPSMEFMYGDIMQQVQISQKFFSLMRDRTKLLEPPEEEEDIQNIK